MGDTSSVSEPSVTRRSAWVDACGQLEVEIRSRRWQRMTPAIKAGVIASVLELEARYGVEG